VYAIIGSLFNLSIEKATEFLLSLIAQCIIVCFYITQHKTTGPIHTIN